MKFNLTCHGQKNVSEIVITRRVADNPNANPPVLAVTAIQTTSPKVQINNAKLYVTVAVLSSNDIKFLENVKQGFKRTNSGNKYRSEITTQAKNNNLHILIYPTFISCLYCYSQTVTIILQEILLINITCH